MGAGNRPRTSAGRVCLLNHQAVSPAPKTMLSTLNVVAVQIILAFGGYNYHMHIFKGRVVRHN